MNRFKIVFMDIELLIALVAFAFVSSATPGPNNLMLMASGANFGVRRTLPHMFGVAFGFVLMIILVGTGLMRVFDVYPVGYELLRAFSIVYLLYLAWKIATSSSKNTPSAGAPLSTIQAALFQWVNPKAWAMALTGVSVYAPSQNLGAVGLLALIFGAINLPSIFVWVLMGQKMQRFLSQGVRLQRFNYSMALLLVATLYPVLFVGP